MLHSPNFPISKVSLYTAYTTVNSIIPHVHVMEGNIYELQTIVTVHIKQGIISNCIILKGIIILSGMQLQFTNFSCTAIYHIWYIQHLDYTCNRNELNHCNTVQLQHNQFVRTIYCTFPMWEAVIVYISYVAAGKATYY